MLNILHVFQLYTKGIAVLESSAVENFIGTIDSNIRNIVYVNTVEEALQGLR